MIRKVWTIAWLIFLAPANCIITVDAAASMEVGFRDPQIFEGDYLSEMLSDLSYDPDVRISVIRARLATLSTLAPAAKHFVSHGQTGTSFVDVENLVRQEGVRGGLDPNYLLRLANRESGLDPSARARRSSAAGLYQFTENTWLCAVFRFGPSVGLAEYNFIRTDSDGRCFVRSPEYRRKVLDLRSDPWISTRLVVPFTFENYHILAGRLGRSPSMTELYALHFFGQKQGLAFLMAVTASPGALGRDLWPSAASANPSIFYNATGRARRVSEIFEMLRL